MAVTGIDQVHFIVSSGEEADAYLRDWGLTHVTDALGERYECADGSAVSFAVEPSAQVIEQAAFKNLNKVIWGVSDQASLNALVADLQGDRAVDVDAEGTAHFIDDIGLAVGLRVSRRRALKAEPMLFNTPGAPTRIDQAAIHYDQAVPQEISHIVLGVADVAAGEAFYRQRLGFHLSDRYVNRGVFLRSSPIGTHHNLFMLDDGHPVFNHLAFKVRDIHEVIGGGQGLVKGGAETLIGPGRHYASSGCFWYFKSPFGGAMEYVADEDIVTPAWQPSELIASPEKFSEWVFHTKDELGALKKSS
jgi:catechol 2,3-dioxygenase-like lactoylglutathione lyase family enzyme